MKRPQNTFLGVGLISVSVSTMAFADALVKLVSSNMILWQIYVARSLIAVPILGLLLLATGTGLRPKYPAWAYVRGLLLVLMWIAYYGSLPVLSLSVAAVALYTAPLIIVLLASLLIGEPVGPQRWIAVILGFAGVVAVLQPGTDAFSWFTLLPVLAAVFYAFAMIITRSKCGDEAPLMLAFALNVSLLVTGLIATAGLAIWNPTDHQISAYPFVLGSWAQMGYREWRLMALLGVLMAAYSVGVAKAYQVAAPPIVATFDYAYLLSAALWSFIIFSEKPSLTTIIGIILITAAGVLAVIPSSSDRRRVIDPSG